jgi:hypothetical protein
MSADAIFHPDGHRYVPTELARGPWYPDAQHGGAPAALLARVLERSDPGPANFVVRLTVELIRPVPMAPLEVVARTTRPGKRVQWLEAGVLADGVEVARASALRLRTTDLDLPTVDGAGALPPPGEGQVVDADFFGLSDGGVAFWNAMEIRYVRGSWTELGPAAAWFRLLVPVVAGEEITPLQRVAAAADFGNGISGVLERGRYLYINPDLTVYLYRPPVGDWVALDAVTAVEPIGIGFAESAVYDERGRVGRSVQSLLVDHL